MLYENLANEFAGLIGSGQYRQCLRLACGRAWSPALDDALRRIGRLVS